MAHEIELKFPVTETASASATLRALGADLKGRWFESNIVFDRPDRSLRKAGILLRLRQDRRTILTLKQPPTGDVPQGVKVWDEHETEVQDFDAMRAILAGLGYEEKFQYQKVREEWVHCGAPVCLDQLPFGFVVEIEGDPDAIYACADSLGLDRATASIQSYHDMNQEYRQRAGLAQDDNFAFDPATEQKLRKELAQL